MKKYILALVTIFTITAQVEYKNILLDPIEVTGIYVTTSSETENIDIPALWERFKQEDYSKVPEAKNNRIYAIYTDYTGDCRQNNPYTMVIGYESNFLKKQSLDTKTVTIPAAVYKVAQTAGAFPDAIIALWEDIFNSDYKQLHTINFETLDGNLETETAIKIYLATQN
jgi:predicted transcriptional regulator YdeE